ncbi:hypothetical protein F3D3_2506 [Fusibacter sp. 3D3]|nr:hypothetical protein F3D3_2506 [Fusibacter sp. 3D3]
MPHNPIAQCYFFKTLNKSLDYGRFSCDSRGGNGLNALQIIEKGI